MRFQKRIKITKGLNLNISKSGIGFSIGPRGLKYSVGPRGTYLTTGLPGTGISHRQKIGSSKRIQNDNFTNEKVNLIINLIIDENGKITICDADDIPIKDENLLRKIKKQEDYKEGVANLTKTTKEKIEKENNDFIEIYKFTPQISSIDYWLDLLNTAKPMVYEKKQFNELQPNYSNIKQKVVEQAKNEVRGIAFWEKDKKINEFVERNTPKLFWEQMDGWEKKKTEFENNEEENKKRSDAENLEMFNEQVSLLNKALEGDRDFICKSIEEFLNSISLPVDFSIDYEYKDKLNIDLDLPKIEDLPKKKVKLLKSGKLSLNEKSQKELNYDYALCVCGLAFYFVGNFFNISPKINEIIVSGYTPKISKLTGNNEDEYIYSIIFKRDIFKELNISNINPIEAFKNFNHIIEITTNYELKAIDSNSFKFSDIEI